MVNTTMVQTEKGIRAGIKKCLKKENHGATKPEVDLIKHILDQAYDSGIHYDVSDLYQSVLIFASNSTHQSDTCLKTVGKMHFKSEDREENIDISTAPIGFFDCEVFPN